MIIMSQNIKCNHKILFGIRLKKFRQEQGLSQESLGFKAGLDRTYVSGCERGIRNIGLENIYKLAIALGVNAASFFKYEDEDSQEHDL